MAFDALSERDPMIHLVLLSGGSGTRLWPLSNLSRSKQFLKVLRDDAGNHVSMIQRVFSQIRAVDADVDVTIATCAGQEFSIRSQVEGDYALVIEPERRDTAPAIMLACAHLAMVQGASVDDTVVVMPIDTYADQAYYDGIAELGAAVRSGFADLVLLGVEPTYPSEKYGYIVPASPGGRLRRVECFMEKPNEKTARSLMSQGALWNCGVFAFSLGYLIAVLDRYVIADTYEEFRAHYSELPKISFDYEVVERAESVAVVPYSGVWKDLGTWNTLTDEMVDGVAGRAVVDETTCADVHVINETGLPMVVAGLTDAVVVATHDGILACGKEASANIKGLVSSVAESRPMYERRHWGEYRVLDSSVLSGGAKAITKELVIQEGSQISYQRHFHRSEVWTVVAGEGEVVLDGLVRQVRAGCVVNIEVGHVHAVRAVEGSLRIIEVQYGDVLTEEDIERFGSYWK